jgi:hypothetical protein
MSHNKITLVTCIMIVITGCLVTPAFASKGKGAGNGDLQQWWQKLPQSEQQMLRDRHDIFQSLPEEKQNRLRDRWQNYSDLPPDERKKMHNKFKRWQKMEPEDRERLRGTYRKFKDLPEEQRKQLKEDLYRLRDLAPEEKEQQRKEIYQKYFPNNQKEGRLNAGPLIISLQLQRGLNHKLFIPIRKRQQTTWQHQSTRHAGT